MNKTSKWEEIIEKYRMWIGGILVLAIVGGSAVLIWRENYAKPRLEDRITKLEDKIGQLETKIEEYRVMNDGILKQVQDDKGVVAGTSSQPVSSANKSTVTPTVTGIVNINTASLSQLDTLPGIGPVTAKSIIDYRTAHGPFKNINELDNVKGIGVKTIDKFRDKISI